MTVLMRKPPHFPGREEGLSLVELMIALTLGLILTLGVIQVFLGSSQTYRTTDATAYLQENLRFSLSRISRDVRMGGNQGCLVGDPTDHLDTSNAAYNSTLWAPGQAVIGWEAPNTGLGKKVTLSGFSVGSGNWTEGSGETAPTAISNNAVAGTDFIVVTGSERANVVLQGNPSSTPGTTITTVSGLPKGTIVLAVLEGCDGGDRFQNTKEAGDTSLVKGATGTAPGNTVAANLQDYDDGASVYVYHSHGYYIGIGVDGGPALFRVPLTPGGGAGTVELVSGVENMQILYGVAGGTQRRADSYVPASSVTNWDNVVSVRIGLLMRSGSEVAVEDNVGTFNLVGTEIDPGADKRARLVATTTIGIRNRLE